MSTWDSFVESVKSAKSEIGGTGPFWYRGHSRRSFRLLPSLHRHTDGKSNERYLYEEFTKGLSGMREEERGKPLDILFRMQHYGVPTRLLDWTRTLGVAVYFAVSETVKEDDPPVVWVLNPESLNRKTNDAMPQPRRGDDALDYEKLFVLRTRDPSERPLALDSLSVNPRMHAQNGAFTMHMRADTPLDTQCPDVVRGITLDIEQVLLAKEFLEIANINDFSMFPDIAGLASQLKRRLA